MIRDGLTDKVIFRQSLKEIRKQAIQLSGIRMFQAERTANSKVLREKI